MGLEGVARPLMSEIISSFNPAEAEDGFRSVKIGWRYSVQSTSFNPAEAEDGFRRKIFKFFHYANCCFNPAEAEEGFRRGLSASLNFTTKVSIQPKPKKGLEASGEPVIFLSADVSIQPKPKKGLEDYYLNILPMYHNQSFNPAEAEEGFRSILA